MLHSISEATSGGLVNRIGRVLAIAAVCAALLPTGCGRSSHGPLELTGSVIADSVDIPTPPLPAPTPAIEMHSSAEVTQTPAPSDAGGAQGYGVRDGAWLRVTSVDVSVGDAVSAGDPLVRFDDAAFVAALEQARADEARAKADLAVLGAQLSEFSTSLEDVEEQRSELETNVADLETQRDDLLVQIEAARALVGSPVATGTPDPAQTVATLEAALAEVDEGLEQAREALQQLDESGGQLGSAVSAIEGAQRAAGALVDAAAARVDIAEIHLDRTTLRAPFAGVVLAVPRVGAVLAANARALVVRPDAASAVRTWVNAEQRERISLGALVQVTADSISDRVLPGAVEDIATEYAYVPTTFATRDIHMSRGFEVTVIVYGEQAPPPGTPVDVTIETLDSALR